MYLSPTWTATAAAFAVTQVASGVDLEAMNLPAWIVALVVSATLGAKFILYVQEIRRDSAPAYPGRALPSGGSADDREMLVLIRQGHEIQRSHLEEMQLLRSDLQTHGNTTQELVVFLRRHEQEVAPAMEKVHEIHAALKRLEEGCREGES